MTGARLVRRSSRYRPAGGGGGDVTTGWTNWYDAQAITGKVDADPVTTWNDSSGNAHHANAGNSSFPGYYRTATMNGHPSVRFDILGGNQRGYYFPNTYAPTEGEAFLVLRCPAGGGGPVWHFGSISFGPSMPATTDGTGTLTDHFGSSVSRNAGAVGIDTTVPWIYHVRAKAGEWTCWVNGVQKLTSATNTATWGVSNLGIWLSGGSFANIYVGWIGEARFRSAFLTSGEATDVTNALATKWGITL